MNLWHSLAGMMDVVITSASPDALLWAIADKNIPLFSVMPVGNLRVGFRVYRQDYAALCQLCEKRGETLEVTGKAGIYWLALKLIRRPVLITGVVFLLISALLLPRYVLFVQVEGNQNIPTNQILEAAGVCGIHFGASRREVRSERVKNALLSALPQLQWAGVNTKGCVAVICVRERYEPEQKEENFGVSSIVASRDGVVLDCSASRGSLLCTPGQVVKAGELLISGYTDCGISIQVTAAQGEIYAQTSRRLEAAMPKQWAIKTDPKKKFYGISFLVGKKRIKLWKDSGICGPSCDRMYEEYYVTLPGGYQLPMALCIDIYHHYEQNLVPVSYEEANSVFVEFEKRILSQLMVAGEVLSTDRFVTEERDIYHMDGSYVCREMIGAVRAEKIGEVYGKTD